ncbi:MAG: hypothetical protein HLUCCA11_02875 [Phormidesmis priestleyi Ana]|uniref:Uncharacterized protein n=1 Tax=Phormidesmis priestleyi Ana TaxID=1666911 RepID=A0A0P7Z384_9CYAN|nr:MAG: hypothetical protein HLUCCA11_02875 [Phormidesmis priestleyi Ana]
MHPHFATGIALLQKSAVGQRLLRLNFSSFNQTLVTKTTALGLGVVSRT